jgi:hypothetical protein
MELLLKAGNEVGRAILKKDDEAECEKHKKHEPEETPDETHGRRLTYRLHAVNEVVRKIRHGMALMLR